MIPFLIGVIILAPLYIGMISYFFSAPRKLEDIADSLDEIKEKLDKLEEIK